MKKVFKLLFLVLISFLSYSLLRIFSFQKEINNNALDFNYKKGVYHVHSRFSDGTGTLKEIAAAANRRKLDFVFLTDHGNPNRDSLLQSEFLNEVLIVGGSEFSTTAGHFVGFNFELPPYKIPTDYQLALAEVRRLKGAAFVAHPFDSKIPWKKLDEGGFDGLEILNCYHLCRSLNLFKMINYLGSALFSPEYALLELLSYPQVALQTWDRLNQRYSLFAIFALDAHGAKIPLLVPSYDDLFRLFTVYVRIVDPQKSSDSAALTDQIRTGLQKGDFFSVLEAVAPANGFDWYLRSKSGRVVRSGESSPEGGELIVKLPFNFLTRVKLIRNGKVLQDLKNNSEQILQLPIDGEGVYRLEIFQAENRFNDLLWIMTNPIFIRSFQSDFLEKIDAPDLKQSKKLELKDFRIESNALGGSFTVSDDNCAIWTFELTKGELKDFWSALALRRQLDLQPFNGFFLQIGSDRRIPLWLQFRERRGSAQIDWRAEFFADENQKIVYIPFEKLRCANEKLSFARNGSFEGVFIVADNQLLDEKFSARIKLSAAGFY